MKTTDTHTIDAPVEAVSAVLADPHFYVSRQSSEAISVVELIDHQHHGDRVSLAVRYAFIGSLNATARAILDPERLTWVQHSEHDLSSGRVAFKILPDHYPDRLRCQGRYRIQSQSQHTSTRTVATELHVRVPVVAAQVERALMDGLRRELHEQAALIPDYVP